MCFLILLLGLLCHFQQIVEVNTVGLISFMTIYSFDSSLVNEKNIMKRILYVFMQIQFH